MQLNQDFEPVMKSSNKLETKQASIAMTSHMFQVLSAGIYQHPERACIRELSCNAWDGHVAAGTTDKPFKVHLPNQLEPWFEVRDFGTGMTHEQVMELYLTYGASTKRDSNDLIGGLGIGSKSPFAIAQSFTVTSFVDGTVRRYSVYMEEGIPQVTKLTEGATQEPNGVSVRVAIPLEKIPVFEQEASRIYTHFPVKPDCNKQLTYLYADKSVFAEEAGVFKIFSGEGRYSTFTMSIVMGNIEYPVAIREITDDVDNLVPAYVRESISHALIYLPIGSVNIAASRESLQLNDRTKKEIEEVFTKVSKQILQTLQAKLDTATNLYEMVQIYNEALGAKKGSISLNKNLFFKGISIHDWMAEQLSSRDKIVYEDDGITPKMRGNVPMTEPKYKPVPYMSIDSLRRQGAGRYRPSIYQATTGNKFSLFSEMSPTALTYQNVFVIDDRLQKNGQKKSAGRAAVLKEMATKMFNRPNFSTSSNGYAYFFDTEAEIDELCKVHHYPKDKMTIVRLSDYNYAYIPKPSVRGVVKLWVADEHGFTEVSTDPSQADEPQYYIRGAGNDLVSDTLHKNGKELANVAKLLHRISGKAVYLFRKSVWNKIPDDWIEMDVTSLEDIVKSQPHLWIEHNRIAMAKEVGDKNTLNRMQVKLKMVFDNKSRHAGYVSEKPRSSKNYTHGVNFEDNMAVFSELYGRVPVVFAAEIYGQYNVSKLSELLDILPRSSKLATKIQKASNRAANVVKAEMAKSRQLNPELYWIDWSRVDFRTYAEHKGFTLTPYVNK